VQRLSGLGLRNEQICAVIGLRSPKTLRRYFSKELALGLAESSTNVRRTAFKMAISRRDPAMTIFFLKTRAGWSPRMTWTSEAEGNEQVIYLYEDYQVPDASE
jgi:hypothetical protein